MDEFAWVLSLTVLLTKFSKNSMLHRIQSKGLTMTGLTLNPCIDLRLFLAEMKCVIYNEIAKWSSYIRSRLSLYAHDILFTKVTGDNLKSLWGDLMSVKNGRGKIRKYQKMWTLVLMAADKNRSFPFSLLQSTFHVAYSIKHWLCCY